MKAIIDVLGSSSLSNNNSTTKPTLNGNLKSKFEDDDDNDANTLKQINKSSKLLQNTTLSSNLLQNIKNIQFEYVLDVTIGYPNGVPLDLPNIVHGLRDPCQTYFFYRLYHSSEVS